MTKEQKEKLNEIYHIRDLAYSNIQAYIKKISYYKTLCEDDTLMRIDDKSTYLKMVIDYINAENEICALKTNLGMKQVSRYYRVVDIDTMRFITINEFIKLYKHHLR